MKHEVASDLSRRLLAVEKELNEMLHLIQQTCDEKEFRLYRTAFASAMGTIFLEILDVIYKEHSNLKPPGYN